MSPTHFTVKSLSRKIFQSVLVFTLCVIVALNVITTGVYYASYEYEAGVDLAEATQEAAENLNSLSSDEIVALLEAEISDTYRYTLIASNGVVLYDSIVDASTMENHSDRPEVQEAMESGSSDAIRYSETLGLDTVYAAVELDDGSVIRLSETQRSFLSFLSDMVFPVFSCLLLSVVLVAVLSKELTKRIMKPIDALDFSNPLENEIYEEMDPLLIRIDEQQRQLKQQNKELELAESLRRDFSSNVSHEMKTPLQVISGYAELMKNDMVQPEDRIKFSTLIYEEAQAMRSLINDVLTLSKLDEFAFGSDDASTIDLYSLAQRVSGRLEKFAHDQGVEIFVKGNCACIIGSKTLAEEMIYNLIENGIRYNRVGGSVTLTVGHELSNVVCCDSEKQELLGSQNFLRYSPSGEPIYVQKQVVVRVADTGPGIAEEAHEKIFERFFRVDKSRSKETGGTGLGLAIVKHAVSYHEGTITIDSALGKGTTFVLRFPSE